jgi:hypothetical protein
MHIDPFVFGWQLDGLSGLLSTTDHILLFVVHITKLTFNKQFVLVSRTLIIFAKLRSLLNIITFQQYCVYIMM